MSMTFYTTVQLAQLFFAYMCIAIWLPAFVFGKTLKLQNRFEKFLVYTVIGNFYVINLVYMLEIFHISNRFTLTIFTVIPALICKIKLENIPVIKIAREYWHTLRRLVGGQLGVKAYKDQTKPARKSLGKRMVEFFVNVYLMNIVEVALIAFIILVLLWVYGTNLYTYYGYMASDVPVHNYWISEMCKNNIFVSGVYPYGFHCIAYFIHQVFGMEVYVILRLISFVSVIWDYMMLLCFMRLVLKSKYLPYLGVLTYALANFYKSTTYSRYSAALPQEYGIMFVLASIYPLIMYFREQRREDRGSASKRTKLYLAIFAMAFSLSLTIHFYGTFIVGLYCIAIAIAFCAWFFNFKKKYFSRIMLTGIASLGIAFIPLLLPLLFGAKFHGSIAWGLNVINNTKPSTTVVEEVPEKKLELIEEYGTAVGTVVYDAGEITYNYNRNVVSFENKSVTYAIIILPLATIAVGLLLIIFRKKTDVMYGATILATGIFSLFIVMMNNAKIFHIPGLMDINRGGVYFSYISMVCLMAAMDGVLFIVTFTSKQRKWPINLCSFVCLFSVIIYVGLNGGIRKPLVNTGQELNGSIECITNIMHEEKDFTWTIVSANDERNMIAERGYHYEIIDFLRGMEAVGNVSRVRIPTPNVYIFVEKRPVNFWLVPYERENISEMRANNRLCSSRGLKPYSGENRLVTMSRMYYWCQTFKELYPNEMTVYYEDEEFICYKIVQNPYRLFNFAIDYDYNMREYPEEEQE